MLRLMRPLTGLGTMRKQLTLSILIFVIWFGTEPFVNYLFDEPISCQERMEAFRIMADYDERGSDEPILEPIAC